MRELVFYCDLKTDYETVKARIMEPRLFLHVAAPLVKFAPIGMEAFPDRWAEQVYRGSMKLFGVIPIGWQAIVIHFGDGASDALVLNDRGYGPTLRKWDHRIEATPREGGGTLYVDRLRMDAGLLTPIAAFFVAQFFKHRQRRLRALDASNFQALAG